MTQTTITSALVGAFHRPPAKQILEALPTGQALLLSPEPENPYDPNAIRVLLWANTIPEELHAMLDERLQGTGFDLLGLLAADEPLQLGYIAASGGKPLAKSGLRDGNQEFLKLMAASPEHSAKLAFGPSGQAWVMLSVPSIAEGA